MFENNVYWTDWKTLNIERINKITGGNRTIISSGLNTLMDIRVFHKNRKYVQTACNKNNGGCSHLCLLVPNNYTCACPTGILIKVNSKFKRALLINTFIFRLMEKLARNGLKIL